MATVTSLYNYPITLTSEEFVNNTGLDLYKELEGDDGERKVVNFLNTIHALVYDDLIFSVGVKTVKMLMLEYFKTDLEKDVKKALLAQGLYLLENSDISLWNGAVVAANGTVQVAESRLLYQKIIAPAAVGILMSTNPNLLYMGE